MQNHLGSDERVIVGLARSSLACIKAIDEKTYLVAALICIMALLVLPPLFFLVLGAVTVSDADGVRITFERFSLLLDQKGILFSTINSFIFAFGSAVLALVIGGTAAWLVERTNAPLKSLTYVTNIIALGTPYVLYTSAWLLLLARSGPINTWYRQVTGGTETLINVYGMAGMILIEGLLWSPLVFLLLGATLRNFNPALEEAARMSGAGTWSIIQRITLPLSLPSILALTMLVFIRTVEAFEVPALVGTPGRVRVLTTDIYELMNRVIPPDIGSASALSLILLGVVAILLYFYGRLTKNAEKFATVTGKSFRPNQFDLGRWRPVAAFGLAFYFSLLIVLPCFILVWASLLPFYQTIKYSAFALVTLDNYRAIFTSYRYIELTLNTITIALVSASVVMILTAICAWLTVRKAPGAKIIDQLGTTPLVFPGIVLGVGVMQFFLNIPIGGYGTIWIIIWAFLINYLPYGVRYSYAGMIQLHRELEEAAAASGATPIQGFRRIVFPLLAPSLIAGWLFIFLLSTRALSLPVLLSGPGSQTMAVAMFDLWGNGQGPELAALGLVWSLAMACIAVLFYSIARRSGGGLPAN